MNRDDLLKWLSDPDSALNQQKPPERAVFHFDKDIESCSSILAQLVATSMRPSRADTTRRAIPLPDIDLPMVF
jgi:hypothetical protein